MPYMLGKQYMHMYIVVLVGIVGIETNALIY